MVRVDPAEELILRCARTELSPSDRRRIVALSESDLDWHKFSRVAVSHGLTALLHRALVEAAQSDVPAGVLSRLSSESVRATAKSLYLTQELLNLVRRLQAEGIDVIPFKGPTLAVQAYGDFALRGYADLDILVRERDVPAAREVLLSEGYVSPLHLSPAQLRGLIRSGYNDEFYRSRDGVKVELHWRFAPAYFGFRVEPADLWFRTERVLLLGVPVPALAPEDLLILLCVHGAKHAWASLEGVVAVAELIRRAPEMDWGNVVERGARAGAARMVRLGLLLAAGLLDAQVPDNLLSEARSDPRITGLAAQIANAFFAEEVTDSNVNDEADNVRLLVFHLAVKDRLSHQVRLCTAMLTMATERDWKSATLPDRLFPLYAVLRPFRLLARLPKYGRWLLKRSALRK